MKNRRLWRDLRMSCKVQCSQLSISALAFALASLLQIGSASIAHGQNLTVLHYFTGGGDGAEPWTTLTKDAGGNLYGTALYGGNSAGPCAPIGGCGTVFRLKHAGSGWIFSPIYTFTGGTDGRNPLGRVIVAPDGSLYGTASAGGGTGCNGFGCGIVFRLRPGATFQRSAIAPWSLTVVHNFSGTDGETPQGDLTFDQAGNIFGITNNGGAAGLGVVYKLTPTGNSWTETVIYSPPDGSHGMNPSGGVLLDSSHNLYGVFSRGGSDSFGAIYELSPLGQTWTEQTLHGINGGSDGAYPLGGLIQDSSGNIYGTTNFSGLNGAGTAFELTPGSGGWAFNLLYNFSVPGGGPEDKLLRDASGNLYGTAQSPFQGNELGAIFKLTLSNGNWVYTPLWTFTGNDGGYPVGGLIFGADGNFYGTTAGGGIGNCFLNGCGVVYVLAP